jgi:hypothetical protein
MSTVLGILLVTLSLSMVSSLRVLYLPLDERFTTMTAFLNLAKLTPFQIVTPDISILPSLKRPANLVQLDAWIQSQIGQCDALVVSMEMYLYGGLIGSRTGNESTVRKEQNLASRRRYQHS